MADHRLEAGEYIKDRREKRGMSQRELARDLCMVSTAISAIELGRNSAFPEKYEQIADALGVPHPEFAKVMSKQVNPGCTQFSIPARFAGTIRRHTGQNGG